MKKFSALLMMIAGLLSRTDGQLTFPPEDFDWQDWLSMFPTSGTSSDDHSLFLTNYVERITLDSVKKFALDMDRAIYRSQGDTKSNVIFSPLNLFVNLAMVLLGSAGVTFDEVSKILGLKSDFDISAHSEFFHQIFGVLLVAIKSGTDSGPQISMANGLFVQNGHPIGAEFQAACDSYYKNKAIDLDFMGDPSVATKFINDWINTETRGKISSILNEELSTNTKLMIASTLYFSAEWNLHFLVHQTKRAKFMVTPNEPVMVDMMFTVGPYPFYQDKRLGVKIIGLPYKGYQPTSSYEDDLPKYQAMMYILLPTSEDSGALNDLQSRLTVDIVEDMIDKMVIRTCRIFLPRMKLSSTLNLKQALQSLGLSSLFNWKTSNLGVLSPTSKESERLISRFPNFDGDGNNDGTDGRVEPAEEEKKYFKYNDDTGDYNVWQWNFEFYSLIKRRVQRSKGGESAEDDETKKSQSRQKELMKRYEIPENPTDNIRSRINRSPNDKYGLDRIKADFNRFIESNRDFTKFHLDALRNDPNLGNPGLFASDVLHKVEIGITETGTVAVAATVPDTLKFGGFQRFSADRPFLFFIRHEVSGLPLFWGTVNKPTPNY